MNKESADAIGFEGGEQSEVGSKQKESNGTSESYSGGLDYDTAVQKTIF